MTPDCFYCQIPLSLDREMLCHYFSCSKCKTGYVFYLDQLHSISFSMLIKDKLFAIECTDRTRLGELRNNKSPSNFIRIVKIWNEALNINPFNFQEKIKSVLVFL